MHRSLLAPDQVGTRLSGGYEQETCLSERFSAFSFCLIYNTPMTYGGTMKRIHPHAEKILIFLIFSCLPGLSLADSGPDVKIFQAIQNDQDVTIRFGYEYTKYQYDYTLSLFRQQDDTNHVLFDEMNFPEAEAIREYSGSCDMWYCESSDEDFCEKEPDKCMDCDDDDIPECCGGCVWYYIWTWLDVCVPPGDTDYILFKPSYGREELRVEVQNTGDECLDGDGGTDTDTDADSDSDSDMDLNVDAGDDTDDDEKSEDESDSGGCSVSPDIVSGSAGMIIRLLILTSELFI